MRKFYLENGIGERVSMSDARALWLNEPKGLGMKMSRKYESVDSGFFEAISDEGSQEEITGTLVFLTNDVYKDFRDITNWIMMSNALKFVYSTDGYDEYYKDINVDAIEKTEKQLSRMLSCAITFTPLTPWYGRERLSFAFSSPSDENYKRYDFRYTYRYAASFLPNSVDFEIDGHYPGEIELRASGPFISPVLTLSNTLTGKIYGKLDLHTIAIENGETFYYSSRTSDPGVWKMVNGQKIDLIDQIEMSADTESFFKVPTGIPVTATMTIGGTTESQATMDIIKYYRLR